MDILIVDNGLLIEIKGILIIDDGLLIEIMDPLINEYVVIYIKNNGYIYNGYVD